MLELNIFVSEFVEAVNFCIEEKKGHYIKDNKYFAIDRILLVEIMNHNKFEESDKKLALWKRLHWIDADADSKHITRNVYIKAESKSRRMIVIDLSVHEELAKFCS